MQLDQRILARLTELIEVGESLGSKAYRLERMLGGDGTLLVPATDTIQWGTSSLSLLERVFGSTSRYYRNFDHEYRAFPTAEAARRALGIIRAAKDDYEHDMLFNTRILIEAEVFDDFLSQAEHLLQQHYYQPAAVVAGAVLEDGLRKLCDRNGIALPDSPKLDRMNADLAKAGAYTGLVQKQITAIADLRNKAAHGEWDKFSEADVANMLPQVRLFMATHFS